MKEWILNAKTNGFFFSQYPKENKRKETGNEIKHDVTFS